MVLGACSRALPRPFRELLRSLRGIEEYGEVGGVDGKVPGIPWGLWAVLPSAPLS